MKSIINHLIFILAAIRSPLCDNILRRIKSAYGIMLIGSVCFTSCLPQYYKVNTIKMVDADSIQHLVNENKNFILHADQEDFAITQIKVSSDHLDAKAETLPGKYLKFLQANNQKALRYPAKDKELVMNTVRLYTSDSVKYNEQVSIPLKDFYKMDIYQFNKAKTTWTHIGVIGGITVGTAALILAIAIAAAGSFY
jgi:hypothetical protein